MSRTFSRFELVLEALDGVQVLRRLQRGDDRGFLCRLFDAHDLGAVWPWPVAQINHTMTRHRGAVRGMHFQHPPHDEAKLVMCLSGAVHDVALDIRRASPHRWRFHAQALSAENGLMMLIPPGFAHGFQALTDEVELIYVHSRAYAPGDEGGLNPQDPDLAIDWPLPVGALSARDAASAWLSQSLFDGVEPS